MSDTLSSSSSGGVRSLGGSASIGKVGVWFGIVGNGIGAARLCGLTGAPRLLVLKSPLDIRTLLGSLGRWLVGPVFLQNFSLEFFNSASHYK